MLSFSLACTNLQKRACASPEELHTSSKNRCKCGALPRHPTSLCGNPQVPSVSGTCCSTSSHSQARIGINSVVWAIQKAFPEDVWVASSCAYCEQRILETFSTRIDAAQHFQSCSCALNKLALLQFNWAAVNTRIQHTAVSPFELANWPSNICKAEIAWEVVLCGNKSSTSWSSK